MRFLPGTISVLVLAALLTCAPRLAAEPDAKDDLAAVSTESLIERFHETSAQSIAVDIVVMGRGPAEPGGLVHLGTGILDDPALAVVRALVRRGAAAVPALLDHLSDARPTGMKLESNELPGPLQWRYGIRYSPRSLHRTDLPPGVTWTGTPAEDANRSETYRFTVGDLCFVTLGKIVNRYLPASEGAWGTHDYHLIYSPSHSPALAAAARADWSGLTTEGLEQSLVADVQEEPEDDDRTMQSLHTLLFYYPDDGCNLVARLLRRPVRCFIVEPDLSMASLLAIADEKKQDRLLARFREQYGESFYRTFVQNLVLSTNEAPEHPDDELPPELAQQHVNARNLAARRFAGINKHPLATGMEADFDSQRIIVEAVEGRPSREIDLAARDLLARTLALRPADAREKLDQCWLFCACAKRSLKPALRRSLDNDADVLGRLMPREGESAAARQAYIRRCERFLRKWSRKTPRR